MVLRALIGQSVAYDRVSSQARPLLVGQAPIRIATTDRTPSLRRTVSGGDLHSLKLN